MFLKRQSGSPSLATYIPGMPYNFERLYGMRFESVVAPDAKNAVLRSADRYIRALSERL
ncbi:MAG: hypothetical protein ACR2H5_25865 [Ktedonobacteraceae bacterium]